MVRQMHRLVPALLAALAACKAPSGITPLTEIPAGAVNIDWNDAGAVRVAHAYFSGFKAPVRTVVDNDADWRRIWSMYTANVGSPPPVPAIDVSRYEVLVAALGERNSGGYDIAISRIASSNDFLYAEITSTRPGPRCGTIAALTQPVDLVRIPRQHPPVMFIEKSAETSC